jgi:hypothetical protein
MEAFDFQLYEPGQVVRTREIVHVTLNKDYRLFFNAKALVALGDPDGVALMFDARRQVIGVLPSALNRTHAYPLRIRYRGVSGKVITARNFCRHHGIKPEGTLAFPSARVNKDGVMILDLQDVKTVKR